ncbi:hypothetical protein BD289DRAFT_231555 [Coniella lustricola]|uniref:Uncharacterized protein n=1 Tax=Coniella lustricola TaxID=2025994 RepID=A0A2T3AA47_9PEZI|nr:hypothetical protein BD289DRAFT_231555 [Coniella lustricola]
MVLYSLFRLISQLSSTTHSTGGAEAAEVAQVCIMVHSRSVLYLGTNNPWERFESIFRIVLGRASQLVSQSVSYLVKLVCICDKTGNRVKTSGRACAP